MNTILATTNACVKGFSQSQLERYFARIGKCPKWSIHSDYCLGDPNKPNDVAVFTLVPYVADIGELNRLVGGKLKSDLKRKRQIGQEEIACLNSELFFHFAFVMSKRRYIFSQSKGDSEKKRMHEAVLVTQRMLRGWISDEKVNQEFALGLLDKLARLEPRLAAGSANLKLLKNIFLISALGASIAGILAELAGARLIGWLSDRDSIIRAQDGLAFDCFHMGFSGLAEMTKQNWDEVKLVYANPSEHSPDGTWYDALNRLPDHLAGALADFSFSDAQSSTEKAHQVLISCITNRARVAVHRLTTDPGAFACDGIEFGLTPFS
ncbi:MAG: hypothetical protein O7H41_03725 [Planctomycetota bacterium]|nr:hypothetical protein [Planctomycetota bacterium]